MLSIWYRRYTGDPTGKHYRIWGVLLYLGYGGSYSEFRQEKGVGVFLKRGKKEVRVKCARKWGVLVGWGPHINFSFYTVFFDFKS